MKFYSVKKQFLILLILTVSLSACNHRTQELVDDQQEKANATPLPPDDFPEDEIPRQGETPADPNLPPAAISCQISLTAHSRVNPKVFESCIGATATEPKYSTVDTVDLNEKIQARIEMNYTSDLLTDMFVTYTVQFYQKRYGRIASLGLHKTYSVNLLNQNSMTLSDIVPNTYQKYILTCQVRSSCSK